MRARSRHRARGLLDDSDSTGGSVPVYHEGDSITVDNGNEFVIELDANPSTGYTWDAGKNPNVKLVSSEQLASRARRPARRARSA